VHRLAAAVVIVSLLWAPASADELLSGLTEITETSHEVAVKLRRPDLAELTVRRTFANAVDTPAVAMLSIDLPQGAVAIGMRTHSKGRWHRAALLEAGRAEAKFWKDDVSAGRREPALLAWQGLNYLALWTEVGARASSIVEYTLLIPTEREGGRARLSYPADSSTAARVIRAASPGESIWVGDLPVVPGGHRVVTDSAEIAIASSPRRLAARHGRALLGGGGSVTRVHVDAPASLSSTPDDLHVVFVIDASRSMEAQIGEQLDVAAAYLAAAPGARFELVRFDRAARPLIGRFAGAAELDAIRAGLETSGALVAANGSHMDLGIDAALVAVRRVRGTPRIVVLSDGLMRSRFSDGGVIAGLRRRGPRVIAHYLTLDGALTGADERIDGAPRARIAAATGGIALSVNAAADAADLRRTALHLVRPIRVDNLELTGPLAGRVEIPGELYEGDGLRLAAVFDRASPEAVELRGDVWARSIDRRLGADQREGDLAAALVFGTPDMHAIEEAEIEALAMRGQVVSPKTSFLVSRPGTREDVGGGIGLGSVCGCGTFGTIGHGSGTGSGAAPITLEAPARSCAETLGVAIDATATVEVSGIEIVDVSVQAAGAAVTQCLTEAIWAHRLEPRQARGFDTLVIALSAAAPP
jgi:hypothetical protein